MTKILAIAKREFRSYFNSPIAYIAITVFLVITGVLFFVQGKFFEQNEASLRVLFEWVPVLFLAYIPAISMRLMSEEKRSGTIELLVTMPITDWQIIWGKYLAGLGFLAVSLLMTLHFPLIVAANGSPDIGPIVGGYVGLFLIGGLYLAVGLMCSTWTRNQINAFIIALLISGFFYFVGDFLAGPPPESWRSKLLYTLLINFKALFEYMSFKYHFHNIERGVIDTRNLLYFVTVIAFCLLVSAQSLAARKWRG